MRSGSSKDQRYLSLLLLRKTMRRSLKSQSMRMEVKIMWIRMMEASRLSPHKKDREIKKLNPPHLTWMTKIPIMKRMKLPLQCKKSTFHWNLPRKMKNLSNSIWWLNQLLALPVRNNKQLILLKRRKARLLNSRVKKKNWKGRALNSRSMKMLSPFLRIWEKLRTTCLIDRMMRLMKKIKL